MTPLFSPIYMLSEVEQLTLWDFLDENLANKFICLSKSPAGAPILFIKKKDGSLWLTVDYCSLNKITNKDQYPLPLIPDLLDHLHTACTFTKMDLHALFQCFMNNVFKDMLDVCVVVYLDNILIFSDNLAKHHNHICKVLCWLHDNNLKIKKCEFNIKMMNFLSFIISPDGLVTSCVTCSFSHSFPLSIFIFHYSFSFSVHSPVSDSYTHASGLLSILWLPCISHVLVLDHSGLVPCVIVSLFQQFTLATHFMWSSICYHM